MLVKCLANIYNIPMEKTWGSFFISINLWKNLKFLAS